MKITHIIEKGKKLINVINSKEFGFILYPVAIAALILLAFKPTPKIVMFGGLFFMAALMHHEFVWKKQSKTETTRMDVVNKFKKSGFMKIKEKDKVEFLEFQEFKRQQELKNKEEKNV